MHELGRQKLHARFDGIEYVWFNMVKAIIKAVVWSPKRKWEWFAS